MYNTGLLVILSISLSLMETVSLAVCQFEPRDGHKSYNLQIMEQLIAIAKEDGAQVISFHELCITAYTHLKDLDGNGLKELAERVPQGPSFRKLQQLAGKYQMTILAGLLEECDDQFYNTYVCVDQEGLVARYRKLHPFINPLLTAGDQYQVFDLMGWKCGILICYDNNVIENVRATALLGAQLIFAPHVTGCTPSTMPGRGFVDHHIWAQREQDPEALRLEFDSLKGRGWLMRWLPARAYDNGVYYAFSNPIGYDGDQLKNGNAMVIDPYGEVLAETRSFNAETVTVAINRQAVEQSGGMRYRQARRPELYGDILSTSHHAITQPVWLKEDRQ